MAKQMKEHLRVHTNMGFPKNFRLIFAHSVTIANDSSQLVLRCQNQVPWKTLRRTRAPIFTNTRRTRAPILRMGLSTTGFLERVCVFMVFCDSTKWSLEFITLSETITHIIRKKHKLCLPTSTPKNLGMSRNENICKYVHQINYLESWELNHVVFQCLLIYNLQKTKIHLKTQKYRKLVGS